ncbi:DMT family transporter [Megamonas hypermegale]|uniref:DMT family transporter n=1 Tax=Megamonas hypermegale TaxID=158847 RepID=UPI0026EA9C70|nr:EamA family transporter [Megamonas hypermegale]
MRRNYIYAIITVFIWSTMAAVTKMLLSDIPCLETLAVSSIFAFLFLLIVNIKNGTVKEVRNYSFRDYEIMAGLGFLGLFTYSALYYYGLTQLSSQEACILNYLWPIMLVIFSAVILKEKITVIKGIAMVCSFLGIVILSWRSSEVVNAVLGIASCIAAAACYGLFSILNKKINYNQNITMNVIWLVVAVCSAILGFFVEDWVVIRGMQWLGIIWLGVFIDAIAYLLWALALQNAKDTAKIANLAYLTPFLSLAVSAVVLGEKLTLQSFIAFIFIIGGILLQNFYGYIKDGVKSKFSCKKY